MNGWLSQLRRRDAVSALTVLVVLTFSIPSILIIGPLGGGGTPANLFGILLLLWWFLAKIGAGQGVDRRLQPLRIGALLFSMAILCSVAVLFMRPSTPKEPTAFYRGAVQLLALFGVALFAADGISSVERLHQLMRRLIAGASIISFIGIYESRTGFNISERVTIPGLQRNIELQSQARSNFRRVYVTALHPIELGSLLGVILPIAVHYALHAQSPRQRRLAWLQVFLIGTVMMMALSRTGVIASTIGLIAVAGTWGWKRRLQSLVAIAAFLGLMRAAVPGLVGSVISMFSNITQDTSTQDRANRYNVAAFYFKQHPVFGRGHNTLFPATTQIFDNAYLYIVIETGAFGLACVLLIFAIMYFSARGARMRTADPLTRGLAQAFAGTAVSMTVMFATADMMSFNMEMVFFFLFAGIVGALWRLTGGPDRAPAVDVLPAVVVPRARNSRRRRVGPVAGPSDPQTPAGFAPSPVTAPAPDLVPAGPHRAPAAHRSVSG